MANSRATLVALVCLTAAALGTTIPCDAILGVGAEFQVNTYTSGFQSFAAVDLDGAGDFVVAWSSLGQDGSSGGIVGRRWSSAGIAQAGEFLVNTYTAGDQAWPAIGVDAAGHFVVAWQSFGQDGSSDGVFARRFNAAGSPLGGVFQVNTYTPGSQSRPALTVDGAGAFVVVWKSSGQDGDGDGVFARRYDVSGTALAAEFQVNLYTVGSEAFPAVSIGSGGAFVVVWNSPRDGDSDGVFGRRFGAGGVPIASEFQVNTYTPQTQNLASVSMSPAGRFVVAWESQLQDQGNYGVFARRFDANGTALGGELQVNTHTFDSQRIPAVAIEDDGDFVVAWASYEEDGDGAGVFARSFDVSGAAASAEIQVNKYVPGSQSDPAVGLDDDHLVVVWDSETQDGNGTGVFAQRFTNLAVLDIDGDGAVDPLTDGLLVLRNEFGFSGATLVSGAVHLTTCTRCEAAAIEAYLQTLL